MTTMPEYQRVAVHDSHDMNSSSSVFKAPSHQPSADTASHADLNTNDMYRDDYGSPYPLNDLDAPVIPPKRSRTKKIVLISILTLAILAVVAIAVAVPLVLTRKKNNDSESSSSNSPSSPTDHPSSDGGGGGGKNTVATTGETGSKFVLDDGTNFTYVNNFGGDWAWDPEHPFAAGGKAQSWSKRVGGEEWVWGKDMARGVNLGGWLVTEPFICPALYEKYVDTNKVADEWSLSVAMGANLAKEMEEHYATFITETDFAEIAAAGLNWVRIPIGFWAIETINDEPFLAETSWKYFLKAIQWARKYGLRIYLDLHSLPGSQNGWNHSGKGGSVNFMHGTMGIANGQRTLTYLRIITEFVSQDQYRDVVPIVGVVNEILWGTVGPAAVQSYYFAAYDTIRKSTGTGAGKGPYVAIHEGFQGTSIWDGFLPGADRLALDQHPYLAFRNDHSPPDEMAIKPCAWAISTNQSQKAFGVTLAGEFSAAINDCGLWLNGIGNSKGPECQVWDDWSSYNSTLIASFKQVAMASMDALQNYFFWTWKIGNSTVLGTSSNPLWHYRLGLQQGWIPKDPREAIGHCASVLQSSQTFDGTFLAAATGGAGAGNIDPIQTSLHAFPPATILPSFSGAQISLLPTYTATGAIKTLPAPTFTAAPSAMVGSGWNNADDNVLAYVPVSGCEYPDPWNAVDAPLPATPCTGS
ncbi:putative glucan 1,3-beta-glucosidase D [Hypsizygus marmoreus]|uniref:glucan 1,3-beta-glucosidase n=1 Tax=Hypsizygus marmoreus TaxID=39966 RepID=A0A369IYW8_HYPMA|nr:putative glucan 1,3-beta-glucosidase D [Hypsizygus marmoreus]